MIPQVITTPSELKELVEKISVSPWIAIDTEFMRESTYSPKLCLIQIASTDICVCVDTLTLDPTHLIAALLTQNKQIKIFHSARQDIEALYSEYGLMTKPLFDTQIAASILGLNEQISYAELVAQVLSTHLTKTESRTDWSRRPLSTAQINYALDDVRYLEPLYSHLHKKLVARNRIHWLEEECARLLDLSNYVIDPEHAWKQVKGIGKFEGKALFRVQQLAAWREQTAQSKNLPRRWVLSDPALLKLAQTKAPTLAIVSQQLEKNAPRSVRHSDKVTALLQQVVPPNNNFVEITNRKLSKPQQNVVKEMMKFIGRRAEEIDTSPSLLANRKSLVNLVLGLDSQVTQGWRRAEIGEELLNMLENLSPLEEA